MSTSAWRILLLAFCLVFLAQEAGTIWLTSTYVGINGATITGGPRAFRWNLTVDPNSPASAAGLRTGDVIDVKVLSREERFRMWSTPVAGVPQRFPVLRNGLIHDIMVTPRHYPIDWALWLAIDAGFWSGLCALVLVLRKPESREVRAIVVFLLLVRLGIQMGSDNWVTPSVTLDAINAALAALATVGWALLAAYAGLMVPRRSHVVTTLQVISYALAAYAALTGILAVIGAWYGTVDPEAALFTGAPFALSQIAYLAAPFLCAIAALRITSGAARERLAWVTGSTTIVGVIAVTYSLSAQPFMGFAQNEGVGTASLVLQLVAPLGITYAMLNRRLLDIGFVLNRAAVYTGVSVVIVGTFVLFEWALSEWFSSVGHLTNLALNAGLALVLGFSLRTVHQRVDTILDTVFFRKRHEDESAIRQFSREAPYITDASILLARATATLERHADASQVTIALDDGGGHFGEFDENDPALVTLRASGRIVDLHGLATQVHGEFAFPMASRGRLTGALVLGPKRSGDSYAPDERNAIDQLAGSLAGALELISPQYRDSSETVIAGIRAIQSSLAKIADRLGPAN